MTTAAKPIDNPLLRKYKAAAANAPERHGIPIRHSGEVSGLLVPALAPLDAADLERLSTWRNRNLEAFFNTRPVTPESTARWLAGIAAQSDRILFLITTSGSIVGHVGIDGIDETRKTGETDSWLGVGDPNVPGIMVLGLAALIEWAFESLGLEALRARVFSDNERLLGSHALLGYRITGEAPYGPMRLVTELTLDRAAFARAIRPRSGDRAPP